MRIIRPSSLHEYAAWYLRRDAQKGGSRSIPDDPEEQVRVMYQRHDGKMRDWFTSTASWYIVSLDSVSELSNLIFLECKWTKDEELVVPNGVNYRLLGRVTKNAMNVGYLARPSAHRHKTYYENLAAGSLQLEGDNRIAICSMEEGEGHSNPAAKYYLLDGAGRSLPYMILIHEGKHKYRPVETFLAEK
jgi:hypothetical protein